MEYKARIQIKDIDLLPLIPKSRRQGIKDGSIKIDINVIGNHLDKPIENLKAYVSIYKIGKQFAIMGLRVVQPQSTVMDFLISNTLTIKTFDLKLVNGLVYNSIKYSKGFAKYIAPSLKGNSIDQKRLALSDFLGRVKNEMQVYKEGDSDTEN